MPHSWLATTTTEATRYNEKILHFHINALEKKGEREKSYADKMENFSVHIKKLQPEKNAEQGGGEGGEMRKIHT